MITVDQSIGSQQSRVPLSSTPWPKMTRPSSPPPFNSPASLSMIPTPPPRLPSQPQHASSVHKTG